MNLTLIVFGASGDLAKKKTFPALYSLYKNNHLSSSIVILGYARSKLSFNQFAERIGLGIKDEPSKEKFLQKAAYIQGKYDSEEDFIKLKKEVERREMAISSDNFVRIYYLAVPPTMFVPICYNLRKHLTRDLKNDSGKVHAPLDRIIIEKPMGRDLDSSNQLQASLLSIFSESQLFRIDHYLGKEMVKNLFVLRFANSLFSSVWDCRCIANVQITFKEPYGIEGRGAYFDEYGIIRDVMQNHIMQIMCLVAMDRPIRLDAESIRDKKTKVLQCIPAIKHSDIVVGQYSTSLDRTVSGYREDPTVANKKSCTPTFASVVMMVENERWNGVPFYLKCGKGLDVKKAEIRIQFKDAMPFDEAVMDPSNSDSTEILNSTFQFCNLTRNELVIRIGPDEAVYLKMMNKQPGLSNDLVVSELDLTYYARYSSLPIPEAYESLVLDVLHYDHGNFVREDELKEAWRIFSPFLHEFETTPVHTVMTGEKVKANDNVLVLYQYPFGTRGPKEADDLLVNRVRYTKSTQNYRWDTPYGK